MITFSRIRKRWRVLRALGRNPLVRLSDRVEAAIMALVLAASLAAIPLAAAVGDQVSAERGRAYAAQANARHLVDAIAMGQTTASYAGSKVTVTHARWRVGSADHVASLATDRPASDGDHIGVWVDGQGNLANPPTPAWRATVDGAVIAAGVWLAATVSAVALFALLRRFIDRVRYTGWDRDIAKLVGDDGGRASRRP